MSINTITGLERNPGKRTRCIKSICLINEDTQETYVAKFKFMSHNGIKIYSYKNLSATEEDFIENEELTGRLKGKFVQGYESALKLVGELGLTENVNDETKEYRIKRLDIEDSKLK